MNSKGQSNDSPYIADGPQALLSHSKQKNNNMEDRMRIRTSILLHVVI